MNKKDYQEPSMRVIRLRSNLRLLVGSGDGTLPDPADPDDSSWT